ncbi:MAG: ATP-binding protein [Acidobacteriaceae bacterium]
MAALILFEIIVVGIYTLLLVHQQRVELTRHLRQRLEYQADLVATEGGLVFQDGPQALQGVVVSAALAPSVSAAQITDMQGRTLASNDPTALGKLTLTAQEKTYLRDLTGPNIFSTSPSEWEAVAPIVSQGRLQALVWIYPNELQDRQDLRSLLRITALWALFVLAGCTLIAAILAQSITRQLATLTRATRRLIHDPEDAGAFPLPVKSTNEAADLTIAFNRMVAAMQEQRAGLNETLALLDSMLANAPIGFAFFDRKYRFVRINQFLAEMNGYSLALHLGRGADVILPPAPAEKLEHGLGTVFETGQPIRNLDLAWDAAGRPRSWLAHLYPVRTDPETTRWVGAILVDTTEQKRSEEALRRTEKLAAAGRLAASIAHEINNPLEAVTNLLYLIRQENLSPSTARFADQAQQEVARVSEIAQQTLRFYRQSTLPAVANVAELLDSIITLHLGRIQALPAELERDYASDLPLFCFAGELRQLFANLITNALDAMTPEGGRLLVRARAVSRDGEMIGVRVTVADTGCGITAEARKHIFEPFFTTKEATGTGLGLWVSEQIIRKHQGRVQIRSRAGGAATGTVFSVFFPAAGVEALVEAVAAGEREEKAVL